MPLVLPNVPHAHRPQLTPVPFQEVELALVQTGQLTHPQEGVLVTVQDTATSLPTV